MVWREAMDVIDERVAGLDVDKRMVVACVRRMSGHQGQPRMPQLCDNHKAICAVAAWLLSASSHIPRSLTW
jgi:hypothetical protein